MPTKPLLYCISGLGADKRAFQFLDLSPFETYFLDWLPPEPDESLEAYASRLSGPINQDQPFYLLGMSFGGIVAQEIAKTKKPEKIILVSSVKTTREMGLALRLVSITSIYRLIPAFIIKQTNLFTGNYFFNIKNPAEARLLKAIIQDTDLQFLKWAIQKIMNWNNNSISPCPLVHVHGTKDRVFPFHNLHSVKYPIQNTGHFLIVQEAETLSKILKEEIN